MITKHGTLSGYSYHHCRCDACRSVKSAYDQAWRRSKKGVTGRGNPVSSEKGTFPSQAAAAKAHGVSERTIGYHLDQYGDLSRLGKTFRRPRATRARRITIGPRSWPSIALLADYVGSPPETVRGWLRRNDRQRLLAALMAADARAATVRAAE